MSNQTRQCVGCGRAHSTVNLKNAKPLDNCWACINEKKSKPVTKPKLDEKKSKPHEKKSKSKNKSSKCKSNYQVKLNIKSGQRKVKETARKIKTDV